MMSNPISGTVSIAVLPQANGQYLCQLSSRIDPETQDVQCEGQTQEHAIAIALEQLAEQYRQLAETRQNLAWDAVERSNTGEPIHKHYHVMLHYEDVIEAESKFEAMHNTMLGNRVVENATIAVIEVSPDLSIEPLMRSY